MSRKTQFAIAEQNIRTFFNSAPRVFSNDNIKNIFDQNRNLWLLPATWSIDDFITNLIKKEIITKQTFTFEKGVPKTVYLCGQVSEYQIASSLINNSFLSHYSAVFLNGLTTQIPKTIYISYEQSVKPSKTNTLTQETIDKAFQSPQRVSASQTTYKQTTFLVHSCKNANRTGITTINNIHVTNLERTLIDIVVRPNYAGGVASVLEIYRNAIDKISVNKLIAILTKLNFIYPYHQAIGFYLEKAGYNGDKLNDLRSIKMDYNFYLTYQMTQTDYSTNWKLFYPKGL